jgi:hypothetical protein
MGCHITVAGNQFEDTVYFLFEGFSQEIIILLGRKSGISIFETPDKRGLRFPKLIFRKSCGYGENKKMKGL